MAQSTEHASEAAELEALWIKMGNCTGGTKRLEPMGTYMKAEDKSAKFQLEKCPVFTKISVNV